MQITITERNIDGKPITAKSADGRYSWFSLADGYITDHQVGKSIYQMSYMRTTEMGSDPVPDDVRDDVIAFRAALREEIKRAERASEMRQRETDKAEDAYWDRMRSVVGGPLDPNTY